MVGALTGNWLAHSFRRTRAVISTVYKDENLFHYATLLVYPLELQSVGGNATRQKAGEGFVNSTDTVGGPDMS